MHKTYRERIAQMQAENEACKAQLQAEQDTSLQQMTQQLEELKAARYFRRLFFVF